MFKYLTLISIKMSVVIPRWEECARLANMAGTVWMRRTVAMAHTLSPNHRLHPRQQNRSTSGSGLRSFLLLFRFRCLFGKIFA